MTEQLVQIPIIDDGAYHLYWYGKDFKKTREDARAFAMAQGEGRQLADIPSEKVRDAAAAYLDGPVWIYSWKGDNYNNGNVVLHPNGSIGVVENANQRLPFLISYVD
ncbi:hypothetical protein AB0395_20285 [Streptosporangium sp. NPDC051023]|uniref:hypothetical protein n=1 Tax=Streptosporangium sp. NPDC051023 TaxID=3155410 RepID=UPI00344E3686